MARRREDETALRDAEHFLPAGAGEQETSPAGRLHRLWRAFATRPVRLDPATVCFAADLLGLPHDFELEALASALQSIVRGGESPLETAAEAASVTLRMFNGTPCLEAEILALWGADLVLAKRLGWDASLPLIATTIAHPSLRSEGRRPRPDDPGWLSSCASAYARAAQEAFSLANELSRRSEKLLIIAPKLRAKGAGRVVTLLLNDDAVSPATAAHAGLSDRASRRLFDRLVALGAVRELSGRSSFRLYGL